MIKPVCRSSACCNGTAVAISFVSIVPADCSAVLPKHNHSDGPIGVMFSGEADKVSLPTAKGQAQQGEAAKHHGPG